MPVGLIVLIGIVGTAVFASIVVGGFFAADSLGLFGQQPKVIPVKSSRVVPAETSAPSPPPGSTGGYPSGMVLNLKDMPSSPSQAAIRQHLLDAARTYFSTGSRFFVNQIWADGNVAVGEIGAEHGGHRVWVVWRGTPWRVVWSGNWGAIDEAALTKAVGQLPPELLAHVSWARSWPAEFKFQP